jgi:hypothetical protein
LCAFKNQEKNWQADTSRLLKEAEIEAAAVLEASLVGQRSADALEAARLMQRTLGTLEAEHAQALATVARAREQDLQMNKRRAAEAAAAHARDLRVLESRLRDEHAVQLAEVVEAKHREWARETKVTGACTRGARIECATTRCTSWCKPGAMRLVC